MDVGAIQKILEEQEADGWLLFDNHGSNRFVRQALNISPQQVLTRRFFYWIPKKGEPEKILHQIESESLDHLPGVAHLYLSRHDLEQALREMLENTRQVLMEYSPKCANPFMSVIDAGTVEMVRELGIEVLSSAAILQQFTSVLSEEQISTHCAAAAVLEETITRAWMMLSEALKQGKKITEYDVQKFILKEFEDQGCFAEEDPCCAVNQHSALPHYYVRPGQAKEICPGDFILIDLWCKKKQQNAVYADITRVAVADTQPTEKQQKIFNIVRAAQKRGIDFVRTEIEKGKKILGWQVDDICRSYIKEQGFEKFFTHRTGHNIDVHLHGGGANFDNLEIFDTRELLPGMCFSVEPGIYLKGEFGVRLESNLLIDKDRSVKVTGGVEDKITCLLS